MMSILHRFVYAVDDDELAGSDALPAVARSDAAERDTRMSVTVLHSTATTTTAH